MLDFLQQAKGLGLLNDFFIKGKTDVAIVPYRPAKTAAGVPVADRFPRSAPEEKGVPCEQLTALLHALERSSKVNLHALTVLCDGAVICEVAAPGYDRRLPHVTHSMCKSLTSLAIGLLYDAGTVTLDTPVYRFFPPADIGRVSRDMKAVTVRHLLTMTSGANFNETGAATETDWVRAFFSYGNSGTPGTAFAYNSMNTYMLSAIVRAVTGEGLVSFLRPRLLEPLGIGDLFWEKCPKGIEKGGWGLYIAQEDAAALGWFCLNRGVAPDGRRLLSEEYLDMATATQMETPADSGDFNYGFQIWPARDGRSFLFNGMLGQNVWVCPENRIVVVTNAGNGEFFQQSTMLRIVNDYLGPAFIRASGPLRTGIMTRRRYRRACAGFFENRAWIAPMPRPHWYVRLTRFVSRRPKEPLPGACRALCGKTFLLPDNNTGILPVFTRLMQNNHTAGLRALSFERDGERFFVTFDEGPERYRLEAGFYRFAPGEIDVKGEHYRVSTRAGFAADEDGRRLLKLDIVFPELSHTRRVKVYFDEEETAVSLREIPGKEVVDRIVRSLPVSVPSTRKLVEVLMGRLPLDYFLDRIYDKFEPRFTATISENAPVSEHTGTSISENEALPAPVPESEATPG